MSYIATVFKVMIASPGDVPGERAIIRELLSEWNVVNSDRSKIVLLPVGWDTHVVPEMGDRPQALINKQILQDCDLLVGVFWTRIGTSTGRAASGTVEEVTEHMSAGKPVMLYFSDAPVIPSSIDHEQYERLFAFKEECKSNGVYESYGDLKDFRSKLYRHLQLLISRDSYFQKAEQLAMVDPVKLEMLPELSKEAKFLLKECALDPRGSILNVSFIGGRAVQVNGNNLVEGRSARSEAIWVGALAELVEVGYVESASGSDNVFKMTRVGYDAADRSLV